MAWIKKFWTLDKPDNEQEFKKKYFGRSFRVKDKFGHYKTVEAESVQGALVKPTHFQINSKGESYLINMLDFYAQANGESVSEEELKDFEGAFDGSYVVRTSKLWTKQRAQTLKRLLSGQ